MRTSILLATLFACTVPLDDTRQDQRQFAASGVIRGTILYEGPRPCTRDGKILGSAVILVYAKSNPPPPVGIADRPVNFTVLSGEDVFASEPRFEGPDPVCPDEKETISVTAPFSISPLDAGEYVVTAFYERFGDFLPSFSTHNQPQFGDVLGGYMDVAKVKAGTFPPPLFSVPIGERTSDGAFRIPNAGYVADGILVSLFQRAPFVRPILSPVSSSAPAPSATPENPDNLVDRAPLAVMTQDHRPLAYPQTPSPASLDALAKSYVSIKLNYGVPAGSETAAASELPFDFQINPRFGFSVFAEGTSVLGPGVSSLWPLPSFSRLVSDPAWTLDRQGIVRARTPTVRLSGLTLLDDSLAQSTVTNAPRSPTPKDHVTVLVQPYAICIPPSGPPGVLVTPYSIGRSADLSGAVDKPLFDNAALLASTRGLASEVRTGCLPPGRYAISLTYPSGQSWTVPNEAGSCAASEGFVRDGQCTRKPRAVLPSQGLTGVIEIVPPTTPEGRAYCEGEGRVIDACLGQP